MTTLAVIGFGRLVKPLKLLAIFRVQLLIYQRVNWRYWMVLNFIDTPNPMVYHHLPQKMPLIYQRVTENITLLRYFCTIQPWIWSPGFSASQTPRCFHGTHSDGSDNLGEPFNGPRTGNQKTIRCRFGGGPTWRSSIFARKNHWIYMGGSIWII